VVSGAAARLFVPLCRRLGGASSRQRDAGTRERVRGLPRSAPPRVDVLQEHTRLAIAANAPGTSDLHRGRGSPLLASRSARCVSPREVGGSRRAVRSPAQTGAGAAHAARRWRRDLAAPRATLAGDQTP